MWIFTDTGYYSVVQKPGQSKLTVRARARGDLERLRERYLPELGEITASTGTDYPFRAMVSREAFGVALVRVVEKLDYTNFKSMIARELGHARADTYHDVWEVLLRLTRDEAATRGKR